MWGIGKFFLLSEKGEIVSPPISGTMMIQRTISLAAPLANQPVDLGDIKQGVSFTVKSLGGSASIALGEGEAVDLAGDEERHTLLFDTLKVSTPGGGTTLILEIHGRR